MSNRKTLFTLIAILIMGCSLAYWAGYNQRMHEEIHLGFNSSNNASLDKVDFDPDLTAFLINLNIDDYKKIHGFYSDDVTIKSIMDLWPFSYGNVHNMKFTEISPHNANSDLILKLDTGSFGCKKMARAFERVVLDRHPDKLLEITGCGKSSVLALRFN